MCVLHLSEHYGDEPNKGTFTMEVWGLFDPQQSYIYKVMECLFVFVDIFDRPVSFSAINSMYNSDVLFPLDSFFVPIRLHCVFNYVLFCILYFGYCKSLYSKQGVLY